MVVERPMRFVLVFAAKERLWLELRGAWRWPVRVLDKYLILLGAGEGIRTLAPTLVACVLSPGPAASVLIARRVTPRIS
jgi:hypothetical protein